MKVETINGSLMTKISDLRKSPMEYFELAEKYKKEIYVLNNNNIAGVMIDKDSYDDMKNLIDELQNEILYLNVEKRVEEIDIDKSVLLNEEEALDDNLNNVEWSEHDGWE